MVVVIVFLSLVNIFHSELDATRRNLKKKRRKTRAMRRACQMSRPGRGLGGVCGWLRGVLRKGSHKFAFNEQFSVWQRKITESEGEARRAEVEGVA